MWVGVVWLWGVLETQAVRLDLSRVWAGQLRRIAFSALDSGTAVLRDAGQGIRWT